MVKACKVCAESTSETNTPVKGQCHCVLYRKEDTAGRSQGQTYSVRAVEVARVAVGVRGGTAKGGVATRPVRITLRHHG
jgi:hypothetical protein